MKLLSIRSMTDWKEKDRSMRKICVSWKNPCTLCDREGTGSRPNNKEKPGARLEKRRCRYIDNITSPNWSATMEK